MIEQLIHDVENRDKVNNCKIIDDKTIEVQLKSGTWDYVRIPMKMGINLHLIVDGYQWVSPNTYRYSFAGSEEIEENA